MYFAIRAIVVFVFALFDKVGEIFYYRFIYRHTKAYKKKCEEINAMRAKMGWGPKYDKNGRIIKGCEGYKLP